MIKRPFNLSIGKRILLGFSIIILLYMGATSYGYYEMQNIKVHSQQVIPLSSQINELQEIGISLESLEKNVDKFFTVAYSEHLEKANKDIDDMVQIVRSLENNTDNTGAVFNDLEGTFSEISKNLNYLSNLKQSSTNTNEINEKRIQVYELITKAKEKHRELLSEKSNQLNTNVMEQEKIILAFNSQLLILIFVILIAGIFISIIISRSILRPLIRLRDTASEIARGNLNVRTGICSNDEVGDLASAFDIMTGELQKTMVSKEFIETVLNGMKEAISVIDANDFTIVDANNFFLDVYGLKKEDVIGKKCHEIAHHRAEPCISPNDICPLMETVKTGKYSMAEHVHFFKGGVKRYMEVSTSPLMDKTGKVVQVVYLAKDITDIKRADEIRIENQKLASASRAKSEFLANMSHELRTPLNAIIGFSELIKMNAALDEKSKHQLDNVLTSGKFLLNIINDILDISKVESGKMELAIEKINVPSFIDETLVIIKEKASKQKILLKNELDPSLLYMEADNKRLKQIMYNLLSNAIKFSKPEGGTITITVKKEADMAKFSVSDTGIGIKDEDIGKLFSAFEQLDSGITKRYGGTGLGLAIAKKLVELHGGTIRAESRYGEGSTFTFTVPIAANKKESLKI